MGNMIYRVGELKIFCSCSACSLPRLSDEGAAPNNDTIPVYYSEQHAKDEGWRPTKDRKFCPPDEDFVWVCPDCWEK